MIRPALRVPLRAGATRRASPNPVSRRSISFARPSQKKHTWKGSALRWGLAGAAVYYYNTSPMFADNGAFFNLPEINEIRAENEQLPTVDALSRLRRERQAAMAVASPSAAESNTRSSSLQQQPSATVRSESATPVSSLPPPPTAIPADSVGPEELEDEAEGEGAFNPETGEINWDCPCLGGMAHGPCGPEFREAFSCFVFSTEEPKGVDCIERFKSMQDCFRAHPDVYGAELTDDPEDEDDFDQPASAPVSTNNDAAKAPAETAPAAAPYSGASHPQDKLPGANATSTPSAGPTSLAGSTGIPSDATSKDQAAETRGKARAAGRQKSQNNSADK